MYAVVLSSGETYYVLAATSEQAAWSALELSTDRTVQLTNVYLAHEW